MINNLRITSMMVVIGCLVSCNKVLEKFPMDKPADVTFLQTEAELSIAVNGIYNNLWLNSISASGQWEYIIDNATDIGWDRNASIVTFVGNGSHSSATTSLADIWMHFYSGIARANYVLANIHKVTDASQQALDRADGQARLLRAYWYSHLITLWGDVPLITEPQGITANQVARTAINEVVDFLLTDLDTAALKLPVSWGTNDKGRVTKGAAHALKSRIALAASRFDVAAAAAKLVMDAQTYSLYPNYTDLFTYTGESNAEVIMEVNYQYGITEHRMPISIFSRNSQGNSTKVPTQSMVDSYECIDGLPIDESPLYNPARPFDNRDPRLKQTIAVPGDTYLGFQFETHKDSVLCWNYNLSPARRVTNQEATNPFASFSGYCWKKTADARDLGAFRNASSLNFILIRLGEVLLNYAEAKIELNQLDNTCLSAINTIRGRATVNMPAITGGRTQAQMREIVRRERKVELAMEGLRLQDIRRWKLAEKVMGGPLYGRPQKPFNYADQGIPSIDQDGVINYSSYSGKLSVIEQRSFKANRDYLLPIPQREMDINKLLVQNPNY